MLMCGSPCGLFVFMASSFHMRSDAFPYGNQFQKAIRDSNQLIINLVVLLAVAHTRSIFILSLGWILVGCLWGSKLLSFGFETLSSFERCQGWSSRQAAWFGSFLNSQGSCWQLAPSEPTVGCAASDTLYPNHRSLCITSLRNIWAPLKRLGPKKWKTGGNN